MSLAFMRQLAFEGVLSTFFKKDPAGIGELANGISLRLDDSFMIELIDLKRYQSEDKINEYDIDSRYGYLKRLKEFREAIESFENDLRRGKPARNLIQIVVDYDRDNRLIKNKEFPSEWEGFPIVYREMEPIKTTYSQSAPIKVGNISGTLCGYLSDSFNNELFGLTCGHVAGNRGSTVHHKSASSLALGSTEYSQIPTLTGNCNRHVAPMASGVDAALVKVDPKVSISHGDARTLVPISLIDQGDLVEIHGQGGRSRRQAKVSMATIWKKIDLKNDGNLVCCGDIFELTHRHFTYIHSPLVKPGDSGSSVVRLSNNSDWVGMVIGRSRGSAYVTFAEHIMDWADDMVPGIRPYP